MCISDLVTSRELLLLQGRKDFSLHNTLDDRMDQVQFQDLPLFKFDKLVVATNSFSLMNKIGRGGFGIVYKGKLEDGKEIAVKRLSRGSGQGLREFMNEVVVISKLQHKNLVRLLGCCVEKEEKLLVYEYMPNKSLDAILFDPHLRKDLDWMKRFIIVEGICRGLLYLHRDSRLKIIHRDLKASNILLDEELNPKISDFGMARIFGSKQDQANTLRVVGTYGYMSPEYAMEGRFSEKSDVFGLGVLLLEIVSGRRNNSFSNYESLSLLSYAWKLWNENDILRLIDPAIDFDRSFRVQILKCIQLGLLCVQEYPEDRPTISALISMLDVDDVADLPRPKKPGFTQKKIYSTDDEVVPQYGEEHVSINLVSDLTILSGRKVNHVSTTMTKYIYILYIFINGCIIYGGLSIKNRTHISSTHACFISQSHKGKKKKSIMTLYVASFPIFILLSICFFCLNFVTATTNISISEFLRDSEILVSTNAMFKIGFFSPTNSTNRYVGIWYNMEDSDAFDVVWVANRNNPIKDSSGVLKIFEDGNLQLSDGQNTIFWSSNVSDQANSTNVAQLQDTGNLIMLSGASGRIIWQSFEHLTNSLLPLTKVSIEKDTMYEYSMLRSWKNASDPSNGRFRVGILPRTLPEFVIWDGNKPYWRSGPWNGNLFLGLPNLSSRASMGFRIVNNNREGTVDFVYYVENESLLRYFLLNYNGNLIAKKWDDGSQKWGIEWQSFGPECVFYGKCGPFGSCNPKDSPICSCLKGFEPKSIDEWSKNNFTSGCVRKTPLQCSIIGGKVDGFLKLKNMNVPDYADLLLSDDIEGCGRKCLKNCSCLAYAYPKGIGCMVWDGSLLDLQQLSVDGAADLFIRLADSELGQTSNLKILIAVIAFGATATFGVSAYCLRRWMLQRYAKNSSNKKIHFVGSEMDQVEFKDLSLFEFKQLEVATSNFSVDNKLGQGGFGPVYKGKLEDGQEIAVKRLSRASGQGLQEFMNEVLVISKLQHNNLVRLLGCCVEGDEKLLVYEYLPNRSLDALLFDPSHNKQLDWKKRFNIINGICRGVLYLHRDSRLKIIHRDLKASNILLDEELNPKISDFGMARIFETKQDQGNTVRVVGTYGYMSPEYAMEGRFSEKSDVFSLGVLLLEIVCGRKNSIFLDYGSLSLLTYAWKLWNENDMFSLIDPSIYDPCYEGEILKCIQLGLICVQEFPEDRPTISALFSMLDVNDIMELPQPKQPSFTQRRVYTTDEGSHSGQENGSINHVSLTVLSGR
ncbi:G-type lectin S-receptor-like serine/threonine-protein kinase At1g11300 [Chenopodium quinoa]|uniref:G-type lectin S-receptor-like serine/threonine-protein kinase At1g11300 n=1 Tax=Chenopodium quinoa TaxID=63459 RepID=UPI000B79A266|nr:G-type lectin S-receptor-like serine/threonine-protein kinase At1g11300 [Chenopodium quinoa]